eukprot:826963-Rhodomonas_salina.1
MFIRESEFLSPGKNASAFAIFLGYPGTRYWVGILGHSRSKLEVPRLWVGIPTQALPFRTTPRPGTSFLRGVTPGYPSTYMYRDRNAPGSAGLKRCLCLFYCASVRTAGYARCELQMFRAACVGHPAVEIK